ncbi:MAG TPA: ATP-binding protein [Candidatus Nanoarchaeia archaeon]|nr:ATP-binding protein [Candidatus Nanoarchaeia archaeon]
MNPKQRSYEILNLVLAGSGALLAASIMLLYALNPASLKDTGLTNVIAGLGGLVFLYYLSLHQLLKKRFLGYSTLALAALSAANLALLILQTGSADSSFYSLWLLVIAASGLFGLVFVTASTGLGLILLITGLASHGFDTAYAIAHLPLLLITLAAAGLAEWLGYRSANRYDISPISAGQLKTEELVSHLADGVMVLDHKLNIQLFNPAAQQLTGWDLESAQGLQYRSVLHLKTAGDQEIGDQNDPFIEAWTKRAPLVKNDIAMLSRAGRKIELSISISPIYDASGQPSGAIGVFRDISQEKQVERQRNEFISTASHEMRTPVAAIEGYIALAMNPKVATIDDRAHGFLDKAHNNTQHLGELFRDLLQVTKLEDNKTGTKNLVPIDLGQLVKDAVSDMQFSAQKKGLSLTFTSTANTGGAGGHSVTPLYIVMGEPERLREVVMNLMENAFKFTTAGGVTVRITGDDNTANVGVSDTGIGIAAEDLPHLFQKFYRIDNSATRTIGGTGLGLYLCRSIVELYNGRMAVESQPGKGSTFRFSLPRAKNVTLPIENKLTTPAPTATVATTAAPAVATPTATAAAVPASTAPTSSAETPKVLASK